MDQPPVFVQRALAQRSKIKNLAPLKTLCVRAIAENIEYFEGKQELFSCLPTTVLNFFHEETSSNPKFIKHVAQNQSERLKLYLAHRHLPKDDIAPLCQLITEKCTYLRCLLLVWNSNTKDDMICSLLSSLPHLRKLSINGPMSDRILDSITSTTLRYLDITYYRFPSSRVSTEKLCQLIQKNPDLEEFCAPIIDVNNDLMVQALVSLKNFSTDSRFPELETEKFVEKVVSQHQKVKLRNVLLRKSKFHSGLPTSDLSENLPCLQTLMLEEFTEVGPFLNFEHITELELTEMSMHLELFHTYASKLTSLRIDECHDTVDLSMIGYFCVNLEKLTVIDATITLHCSYKLGHEHFSALKDIGIGNAGNGCVDVDNLMYTILSAPDLYSITLYYIEVPTTIICQLISEAEENGVVFSQMKDFAIPGKELSAETAIKLVCVMPKLKVVNFHEMSDEHFDNFQDFLHNYLPNIL